MTDEYRPLIDRERSSEPRVHIELTPSSRERLSSITAFVSDDDISWAMNELRKKIGFSDLHDYDFSSLSFIPSANHIEFIHKGKTKYVLTYIELLVNRAYDECHNILVSYDKSQVVDAVKEIEKVLETECLLWKLEHQKEEFIEFREIESEAMARADEELRALSEEEPWNNVLRGYNAAFERYVSGDYDELIPKKLYNSVEELLQTICVEKEEWTDNPNLSHSEYLDLMREKEVYDANGITAPELNSLLDALEKLEAKLGNDRKQRHHYIDREYCTLLIHQVGAYLYFPIDRYKSYRKG